MQLRRDIQLFVAVVFLACFMASCGGGGKDEKAPPGGGSERRLGADNFPKGDKHTSLTPSVLDTLRAKKRVFGVTRDEYWEGKGGVLANEYFEVWYPAGRVTVTHGMYLLEQAMSARGVFERTFGLTPPGPVVLVGTPDLESYKKRTGREWWYYAEIKGDSIIFQPIYVLAKRGLGTIAAVHEYSQWAIRKLSEGHAPRWLEEGLASYLAQERHVLIDQLGELKNESLEMDPGRVEKVLAAEKERLETRLAYYHAYKMVETLVDRFGEKSLVSFVEELGKTGDPGKSARAVFDLGYDELLRHASDYAIDAPEKAKSDTR